MRTYKDIRSVDSVRLNSVFGVGVLSQIFPKLINGLLLGSADVNRVPLGLNHMHVRADSALVR